MLRRVGGAIGIYSQLPLCELNIEFLVTGTNGILAFDDVVFKIFHRSLSVPGDNLHFRFQFNLVIIPNFFLGQSNQSQNILSFGIAKIDYEITMQFTDLRISAAKSFQSHRLNQFGSIAIRWVLKD